MAAKGWGDKTGSLGLRIGSSTVSADVHSMEWRVLEV